MRGAREGVLLTRVWRLPKGSRGPWLVNRPAERAGSDAGEIPLILTLDVGTSSCRASLYDARGRSVAGSAVQLAYSPRTTADGGADLDADALAELVFSAIDGVARWAGPRIGAVVGVAACTFWHSVLGVDSAGRALTPVHLWMDARSRDEVPLLKRELDERATQSRTGCVFHWSYLPAKLRWLRRTQPGTFARVSRWVSFGEYLYLRLFGPRLLGDGGDGGDGALSVSMASGTGLLDQHTCDWDDEVLGAAGIDRASLSSIDAHPSGVRGLRPEHAERWPALAPVPWLAPIGDGAASNLGAGCATRERFALMVGTSGALRVLWRAESVTIPWGVWCYRADRHRVLLGGALNDGGSLVDWLRRSLQLPGFAELEQAIAALPPDGHGLSVLPFWAGERSPGWADDARGAVLGLRLHTTPAEIYRAALEGIALRFARLDEILRQVVPEAREVVATGGALLPSPTWLGVMAEALGRPVLASIEEQASSRGAALLALDHLGQLEGGPLESLGPSVAEVHEPAPERVERLRMAAERQNRLYDLLVRDGAAHNSGE